MKTTFIFGAGASVSYNYPIGSKLIYDLSLSATKSIEENDQTFDIDLLVKAKQLGYKISSIDIKFHPREKGESKTQMFSGTKRGIFKFG